jgi:hypothetical protein
MNFDQEISQLKDTLVVMAEIQRRHAAIQKTQAEEAFAMHESMRLHRQRMEHVELTLGETGDKLNGLIGFMDGGYFRKQ